MKCPECQGELACGWWCNRCKLTLNQAAYNVALRKILNSPDYTFVGILVVLGAAAATSVACKVIALF